MECQESLQQHMTSNDPVVQTQTMVTNCSGKAKIRQALEYAADFTIRPFNTNVCVIANSTMYWKSAQKPAPFGERSTTPDS
jgi:hypothetical protein